MHETISSYSISAAVDSWQAVPLQVHGITFNPVKSNYREQSS